MKVTEEVLINEIKVLQRAAKIHAKYSIEQYKKVLKYVNELEKEKKLLESKVKERTKYLEDEMKQKEILASKLNKLAKYDQLTGLANRLMFFNEIEKVYKDTKDENSSFTIFFIDLDGFKMVNDTYGHEAGDFVLRTVAQRLKKIVRKSDVISRLGGDEFTIILKDLNDIETIKKIASKIIKELARPIRYNNNLLNIGASIGIYLFDQKDSISDIIAKSDIAMYEAKKSGKGRFVFFNEHMKSELENRVITKNNLKNAIRNKEIEFYIHPIVNSLNLQIKGFEVLSRWEIPPIEFIALMEEEVDLLKEFTFWQIENIFSCAQKYDTTFSINLSGKLLMDFDLVKFLRKKLKYQKIDTSKIFFEITETALATNLIKASKILQDLKDMNFNISLDDFGTGYSSLAYIKNLPIDTLKIDKEFIKNLNSNKDIKLFKAIINMAEILDMNIVLEGIEKKHQLKYVQKNEHINYQGFLFYEPVHLNEIEKFIKV